ncbi:hypothetical protein HaLaN_08876 [Haematococcus lacustris]|uniref:Uncharacterized protein n=1 Tax=Haematococcus lacustris TaxID=44745 RepID=A0A699YTC7_HAELA|nr:hypothetical protein HaLaN_08876 [Haematococcus lacustris]
MPIQPIQYHITAKLQSLIQRYSLYLCILHCIGPGLVWGGGGLSATSLQPLSDPTAAADAHAHVEQPERRGRSKR